MPDVKPLCLALLVALGCGGGALPVVVAPVAAALVTAPVAPAAASEPVAPRPSPPAPPLDSSKITAPGTLSPLVTIEVTSPYSGQVVSVSVDAGMVVKKGQALAQLAPGNKARG